MLDKDAVNFNPTSPHPSPKGRGNINLTPLLLRRGDGGEVCKSINSAAALIRLQAIRAKIGRKTFA